MIDDVNKCPNCGRSKVPDSIGHRHTGALCYWCGFSTDRDVLKSDTLKPTVYVGQIMAECDCSCHNRCNAAGYCIADRERGLVPS